MLGPDGERRTHRSFFRFLHPVPGIALVLAVCASSAPTALANGFLDAGGGNHPIPTGEFTPAARAALLARARSNSEALGLAQKRLFAVGVLNDDETAREVRLGWPVQMPESNLREGQAGVSSYVDLDAAFPDALRDYACGMRTYDTAAGYNHQGVDIASWPYPWQTMAEDGLEVVAAAPGTIVVKQDGQPDDSCAFGEGADWNGMVIEHADGSQAIYGHMKRDSLNRKAVGDQVVAGETLGQVGSSGNSTGPHLHFEFIDPSGAVVDPYQGECGTSDGHWRAQPAYAQPRINAVTIGSAAPMIGGCNGTERPHEQREFQPNDPVYITAFMVDQEQGQSAQLELYTPSGELYLTGDLGPATEPYPFTYYWRSLLAPAETGRWRARVLLADRVAERAFYVGVSAPAPVRLDASIIPASRTVQVGEPATFFATLNNASDQDLEGCRVGLQSPLDVDFRFREVRPGNLRPRGTANAPVDIAAGESQTFLVTLTPNAVADALEIGFGFRCADGPRARKRRGENTLQLTVTDQPAPDIMAVAATVDGDGVVRLGSAAGESSFAMAAINPGSAVDDVIVTPRLTAGVAVLTLCETDAQAICLAEPSASLTLSLDGTPRTFSVFVAGSGTPLSLDESDQRVVVEFVQGGRLRAVTGVAVTTDA
ncbi:MAG: M23 family metallopeptidase [Pseudomonadota bacterium]